jgi:hypothetical protein
MVVGNQAIHSGFVTQNTSSAEATAWIDGEHSHFMALFNEPHPKAIDEGAFTYAWDASNPDSFAVSGVGLQE